jgi:RNA polymerase sigma factor (sigma-70 family)
MFDLEACLRGSKPAWDAFVERFGRVIYAAVHRTLHLHASGTGQQDAQDVAQDVFVRLVKENYRLLRTYDAGRASLSTWLTIVARSVAVDHVRRRRLETVPLEQAQGAIARGDASAQGGRHSDSPDLPIDLLSPRQRLVLHLLFDREMTVAQAAGLLSVDEQTIRSTKHKAIQRLRSALGERPP